LNIEVFINKENIMKQLLNDMSFEERQKIREQHTGGMNVTSNNFRRLVNGKLGNSKPLISEQEEYNIEKTVIDTKAFTNEDIPEECKGVENPEMSKVEMITACIAKITEKSSSLSSALTALTELMNKAKSDSSSMA